MNCMNCKSVVDVGMEICPNCGFNLRVQRKCFSLSNMYYNLGLDKAEIRDLSGAIDMLRRSLKFNKYNIHARNLLGLVYFETGEAVAALSEWIISKNIMPENNVATEYIATLQAEQAKLDMINQTIKKYNSALKCCRENNEDVAAIQLRKILNQNPKLIKGYHLLALIYLKKEEYEKARRISPNGIIGFNIMVALKDYREHVIEAAKAGADIIVSGAGLPTELPEYLKGFKTKMAPIVSSVKSAKVILKYWDRRHNTTADMIIIEGPKAGGHLGFSVEELECELDFDNVIQGIIDVVKEYEKKYNKDIPVVVAGGISDKNKVKHAFDLGAQGVQVATRFVPTKECDADENYKKEYIKAKKEDIVIVKSPVGMPGRAIKNKFMEKVINGEKFTPKKCLGCLARCNPKEIPYCITERLIYAAKGKTDEALLFCGADAYKVNKITTVKKVFKELLEEKEV